MLLTFIYLPASKTHSMIRQKLFAAIALLFIISSVNAQEKKDAKKWDVSNPEGPYKEVSFTVNEAPG
ncbi:MAG: hypothetical protein WDO16_18030 [Bacteroidota bacterium]